MRLPTVLIKNCLIDSYIITVCKKVRTGSKIEKELKVKKMGAAYSEDLRRRIIKASEQSKQSVIELAKRFEVDKTFVNNLLNRYKKIIIGEGASQLEAEYKYLGE